jgi:hypothetical protein
VELGAEEDLVQTLHLLEPRLKRLLLLMTGGVATVNGDIGIGPPVPVPLMGEGIQRLLSILLAIASAPGGVVLVDEIENGLHYTVMTDVWRAINQAAERFDTQVFATTHSWECIRAAHDAFSAVDGYDLRLIRLDRTGDDIREVDYNQEMLATAFATGLEVR